eukprot:Colp12_sorted_trinity150504_noHs@10477
MDALHTATANQRWESAPAIIERKEPEEEPVETYEAEFYNRLPKIEQQVTADPPAPPPPVVTQVSSPTLKSKHKLVLVNFTRPERVPLRLEVEHEVALGAISLHYPLLVGTVLVKNLCFRKVVIVRYTTDSWDSFNDETALYSFSSAAGDIDCFRFDIDLTMSQPRYVVGAPLHFCIVFRTQDGREFWSNNFSQNFTVTVEPPPCIPTSLTAAPLVTRHGFQNTRSPGPRRRSSAKPHVVPMSVVSPKEVLPSEDQDESVEAQAIELTHSHSVDSIDSQPTRLWSSAYFRNDQYTTWT